MVSIIIENSGNEIVVTQWNNNIWKVHSSHYGSIVHPVGLIDVSSMFFREISGDVIRTEIGGKYIFAADRADLLQVIAAAFRAQIDNYPPNYPAFAIELCKKLLRGETATYIIRGIIESYRAREIKYDYFNYFIHDVFKKSSMSESTIFGPLDFDIRLNNHRFRAIIRAVNNYCNK